MEPKLDELSSKINRLTPNSSQVELNCNGFNIAYEVFKGYEDANRTYREMNIDMNEALKKKDELDETSK